MHLVDAARRRALVSWATVAEGSCPWAAHRREQKGEPEKGVSSRKQVECLSKSSQMRPKALPY